MLNHQPSLNQPLPLRDFHGELSNSSANSPNSLSLSENSLEYKLDRIKKNAVRTFFIISEIYPSEIQTLEIAKKSEIHRSTISVHVKELEELDLIEKRIVPGTENKLKPTYSYKLASSIDRQRVREIFEIKFPGDPLLGNISQSSTPSFVKSDDEQQLDSTETAEPVALYDAQPEISNFKQPFEEQIVSIIKKMAQEIVALQNRVSELEDKLSQESRRGEQVDLTEVFTLLNSAHSTKAK